MYPNIPKYTISCANSNNTAKAKEVFCRMLQEGAKPTIVEKELNLEVALRLRDAQPVRRHRITR